MARPSRMRSANCDSRCGVTARCRPTSAPRAVPARAPSPPRRAAGYYTPALIAQDRDCDELKEFFADASPPTSWRISSRSPRAGFHSTWIDSESGGGTAIVRRLSCIFQLPALVVGVGSIGAPRRACVPRSACGRSWRCSGEDAPRAGRAALPVELDRLLPLADFVILTVPPQRRRPEGLFDTRPLQADEEVCVFSSRTGHDDRLDDPIARFAAASSRGGRGAWMFMRSSRSPTIIRLWTAPHTLLTRTPLPWPRSRAGPPGARVENARRFEAASRW